MLIHYGDMITQTIKSSGDMGTYMFDGKAGEIVFIVATGAGGCVMAGTTRSQTPPAKPVA